MVNKYFVFFVCSFCFNALHAQSNANIEVHFSIEKYIENSESSLDYTDLYDQIDYLIKHPVNINNASANSLASIPLFTPLMVQSILQHRRMYGDFKSIYELQQIDGFEPELIKLIVPFISIHEVYSLNTIKNKSFWSGAQHELISLSSKKLETSKGYTLPVSDPNRYLGNSLHQVMRYTGTINEHLQFNFTSEKDAGEKLAMHNIFISGGVLLSNLGKVNALAIGDFQAAFGQGLTFGSGLAFGKSPFVMNIMRSQNGIRAYHSLNENEFLRGFGTTISLHEKLQITCFYSGKKIDGTTVADTNSFEDGFSSLVNTGYHRSPNEINKQNALKRRIAGTHLTFQNQFSTIGFTAVKTFFDQLLLSGNKPYQAYNFTGNSIVNLGTDYKFFYKNFILFGEISTNKNFAHVSAVNGLLISLGKNFDLSFMQRNYDVKYITSITNAIGESSDNRNERGTYAGFSLTPYKGFKLNGYADMYRFNWLRYLVDAPATGKDMMLELQYAKRNTYNWYLRFRNEIKQKNEEGTQHLNRMENNNRTQFRFHIEYIISPKLTIKNRVEFIKYEKQFGKTTTGFLMFQDFNYAISYKFKIVGRVMYFDAQDYDSRLYAYENDMHYTYTVPSFQNRGTRFYILAKYKLKRNIDIWTRIGRTSYENINTIGSSYDQIEGNKVTEIKIQLKWTL